MKKGVIFILLLLLVSFIAVGAVDEVGEDVVDSQSHVADVKWLHASADSNYVDEVWELNEETLKIDLGLDQFDSDDIKNITLVYDGVSSIIGADSDFSDLNKVIWEKQKEVLQVKAIFVELNDVNEKNFTWGINIYDVAGEYSEHNLTVTVKNDSYKPTFTSVTPNNYAILNNETHLITVSFDEIGSGISDLKLIGDDNPSMVVSVGNAELPVTMNNVNSNSYEGTFDPYIMDLDNGQLYFDHKYTLSDKAGNENLLVQHLFIDMYAPVVTPIIPYEGAIINTYTEDYGYEFSDNSFQVSPKNLFNPQINCTIYIDNNPKTSIINTSNGTVSLNLALDGLNDGSHSWNVICVDSAEWETPSVTRTFILDTNGPTVSAVSPTPNTVIINGTTIILSVNEEPSEISKLLYSVNGYDKGFLERESGDLKSATYFVETADWISGENTLIITANDTLNNVNQTFFTFIIDNSAPDIELLNPINNTYSDGNFEFKATDDYSYTFNCSLNINNDDVTSISTFEVDNDSEIIVGVNGLDDGDYQWNVNCTDNVGNHKVSESRAVRLDTTDPVVVLDYPITNVFGYDLSNINTAGTSDFKYSESDNYEINSCKLFVNDNEKKVLTGNESGYNFTEAPQNTPYEWYVWCDDKARNENKSDVAYLYYDTIVPSVSSLNEGTITSSSALISFDVSEESNHTVYYGTNKTFLLENTSENSKKEIDVLLTNVTLDSLSAETTYYYVVYTCDQFKNCNDSTNLIDDSEFTTIAAPSVSSSGSGGGSGSNRCNPGFERVNGRCVEIVAVEDTSNQCSPLWRCNEWSECNDGSQTRTCQDWNVCGDTEDKPEEEQSCEVTDSNDANVDNLAGQADSEGTTDGTQNPLGVGQATGVFGNIKSNWKPIVGALAVLSLLGLAVWQKPALGSFAGKIKNLKGAKLRKEEAEIRKKLREQGLIK
ncbi:MAG: hypothetical protein ABIH82_06375 [Candidatus Woesearchaeota archaeon]